MNKTQIELTVIIPAFNEEKRISSTLIDIFKGLESSQITFEIIVVDDGSADDTSGVVKSFQDRFSGLRLLRLHSNCGKGCAIRKGVQAANGKAILINDADGSTPIEEVFLLLPELEKGSDLAIGSRALHSNQSKVEAKSYRIFIGRIFNFIAATLLQLDIADTQCGFKLMKADAARFLFSIQEADRFSFDTEILYIARRVGMRITEIPVNWHHVDGSKVNLITDSLNMFLKIFQHWWNHHHIGPAHYQTFLVEKSQNSPQPSENKVTGPDADPA